MRLVWQPSLLSPPLWPKLQPGRANKIARETSLQTRISPLCALTPELSRPAKRVRLGRTVMRAKVNPKPAARNGAGRVGSTGKASEGTEQIEASKDRSRQRRQSEGHETILVPSGANVMHPKPSEAKPGSASEPGRSATDQRRSLRCSRNRSTTEADNTNTPTHA